MKSKQLERVKAEGKNFRFLEVVQRKVNKMETIYFFVPKDEKKISGLLKVLSVKLPLDECGLKRVYNNQTIKTKCILLGFKKDFQKIQEFCKDNEIEYQTKKIPDRLPQTRDEFKTWKQEFWLPKRIEPPDILLPKVNFNVIEEYVSVLLKENVDIIVFDPIFPHDKVIKWKERSSLTKNEFYDKHQIVNFIMSNNERLRKYNNHLFTGSYLIIRNEPCLMCIMALLHYRVSAVCFLNKMKEKKGFLSNKGVCIHQNKMLNHRFQVFWCTNINK